MFPADVYHIYVRYVWGSILFEKRHSIIVECRKQDPILWKSSLEGALAVWTVPVSVILPVILRIINYFSANSTSKL